MPSSRAALDYVLGVLVATVVQIEEVDCGRHSGEKCFGECEQRPRVDRVAVELLREGIEHVVPPRIEGPVVREALEQVLKGVTVSVDGPWKERDIAPVVHVRARVHVRLTDHTPEDAVIQDHH